MIWIAALKNSAIAMTTTVITFWIVWNTFVTKSLHVVKIELIVFQMFVIHVVTVVLIVVQIFVKNVTIPFQMPSKNVLMLVHTSFHEVPNHPRKTSKIPVRISTAV